MLSVNHLSKTFPGASKPTLDNIHFHLNPGDFCVLIGSNGSGKSTLLKTISGECVPDTGSILLETIKIAPEERSNKLAFVTQDVNQGTIPEMTLLENMVLGASRSQKGRFTFYHRKEEQLHAQISELGLGLERYLHTPLSHLSGGQRQIIATMMAITSQPKLLLLDEHTSALDPTTQQMVMDYSAKTIAAHKVTTLMITHHLADAIHYGNRLIMLHEGKMVLDICEEKKSLLTTSQLLSLFHAYEDQLLLEGSL